jgi:hypothetical protein
LKLQLHPLIRIFRVIGGISVLSILTKQIEKFNIYALYIAVFISVIFCIYMFYISYNRIKHVLYTLKTDKLEVRNSPLDHFASYAAKLLYCVKGVCEAGAALGFALGVMAGFDRILEYPEGGRDPVFYLLSLIPY